MFGYPAFRSGQEAIIDTILSGRDLLAILPTGGGKSICYQVPALMFDGMTIVISPLISLMKDQVETLRKKRVPAAFFNSTQTLREQRSILTAVQSGRVKLLYVSPERLQSPGFQKALMGVPISFVCIDEAHSISMWGAEFRPAYKKIPDFLKMLPSRPTLAAFTATATPRAREEIIDALNMSRPVVFMGGFDRKNLYYEVRHPQNKMQELMGLLKAYRGQCGIIYCLTRNTVDHLTRKLNASGIEAVRYHAGLPEEERQKNQDAWIRGDVLLIVATNAFGMGIDKPNVRYVIHYNMAKDVEGYYQEAGRAGRDGRPSDCIMLAGDADVAVCRFFISRTKSRERREVEYKKLRDMQLYAGAATCLRAYLLRYFGEHAEDYCGHCSVCIRRGRFPQHSVPEGEEDPHLFHLLREVRRGIAEEKGVLPDKIFSDQTMHDLAARRPTTRFDFMCMEGAGILHSLRYGEPFLREIRVWRESHPG